MTRFHSSLTLTHPRLESLRWIPRWTDIATPSCPHTQRRHHLILTLATSPALTLRTAASSCPYTPMSPFPFVPTLATPSYSSTPSPRCNHFRHLRRAPSFPSRNILFSLPFQSPASYDKALSLFSPPPCMYSNQLGSTHNPHRGSQHSSPSPLAAH